MAETARGGTACSASPTSTRSTQPATHCEPGSALALGALRRHLVGTPFIQAFVVGSELDSQTTSVRTIGDAQGRVEAWTYAALVATANARLFRVRDEVADRYPESARGVLDYLKAHKGEAEQMGISFPRESST